MINAHHARSGGFTLIEIMIVVAIIGLLAAIAAPTILRARKRSQAIQAVETCRMIDGAKDQYALEFGKIGAIVPNWNDLYPYVKTGNRLYTSLVANSTPQDGLNNPFTMNQIDTSPKVSSITQQAVSDVIPNPVDFWGPFY